MVDAFIPKLEAARELLPLIVELCGRNRDALHKGEGRQEDWQQVSWFPPGSSGSNVVQAHSKGEWRKDCNERPCE
jgi:hypothetical protein